MHKNLLSLLILFLFSADIFADNHSLSFDGVDDYVEIIDSQIETITNSVSFLGWIKLDDDSNSRNPLFHVTDGSDGIYFGQQNDGESNLGFVWPERKNRSQ